MTSIGRAVAKIEKLYKCLPIFFFKLTCWSVATGKWITNESLVANTQWDVVADSAVCVGATQPRTGVNALLVSASQLRGAVRVELALWPAVRRLAYHAGLARAVTAVTVVPRRVGVGPTGVGVAGVFFNDRSDCCKNNVPKSPSKLHGSWSSLSQSLKFA